MVNLAAYRTAFASGSFAPMTWNREQCPNGLPPAIDGDVLRLAVQSGAYPTDGGEGAVRDRCELRDPDKLPMGTPVFYGFDMRVPADFPNAEARFVCAQLKASYDDDTGGSPLFALRIEGRRLMATVELLFEPGDESTLFQPPAGTASVESGLVLDHHDFADPSGHQIRVAMALDANGLPPALAPSYRWHSTKVSVRQSHPLPDLDDRWHRFALRLEPAATIDYEGVVQLWCEGVSIAAAVGQIGLGRASQWFKIGPYRDKSPAWGDGEAALEFRDIRRGFSLGQVV